MSRMLNGRQLLAAAGIVLAIAACERTITGPTVDRPFPRTDTLIVTRPETTIVVRPETSYVQLPGRVDTVIVQRPPRVDTTIVVRPRVDTVIVTRPDTVIRVDTLRIITHDTVVVHDTVRHTDTIVVHDTVVRTAAFVCRHLLSAAKDTMYMQRLDAIGPCAPGVMAPLVPTVIAVVLYDTLKMQLLPAAPNRIPSSRLILPGWRASHP